MVGLENDGNLNNGQTANEDKERIRELKDVYEIAIKTRDFEIQNLIHRNNFYMLFQGVLLASALATEASKPWVELIICICGVFVSFFQVAASSGAKYWQEYWEIKVNDIEQKLGGYFGNDEFIGLFQRNDESFCNKVDSGIRNDGNLIIKFLLLCKFSVSRQPIYTAIALLVTWFLLLLHTFDICA